MSAVRCRISSSDASISAEVFANCALLRRVAGFLPRRDAASLPLLCKATAVTAADDAFWAAVAGENATPPPGCRTWKAALQLEVLWRREPSPVADAQGTSPSHADVTCQCHSSTARVVGFSDGSVRVLPLQDGTPGFGDSTSSRSRTFLLPGAGSIRHLQVTGTGAAIRIFAGTWAGQVLELDVRTGAIRTVVSGVAGPVYALRVHDPFLYCGSGDGRIGLYNVRTGALLDSWQAHDGAVTDICELVQESGLSGSSASAGGTPDGAASIRTSSRVSIDGSCGGAVSTRAAAEAAAARALVAAAAAASVWTPPETAAPSSSEGVDDDNNLDGVHGGAGAHVAADTTADADVAAALRRCPVSASQRFRPPQAVLHSGSQLRLDKLYAEPEALCGGLRQRSKRSATESPADTRLVTCSYDGRIKVWAALPSRALLADIQAHRGPVWSIACAGSTLFSASADGTVKAWRPAAGGGGSLSASASAPALATAATDGTGAIVAASPAGTPVLPYTSLLRTPRTPSPGDGTTAGSRGSSPPIDFRLPAIAASAAGIVGSSALPGIESAASTLFAASLTASVHSSSSSGSSSGDGNNNISSGGSVLMSTGAAGHAAAMTAASDLPLPLQAWECAWTASPSGGSAFRKQVMCLRLAGDALFAGASDGAVLLLRASTGQLCWRVALGTAPAAPVPAHSLATTSTPGSYGGSAVHSAGSTDALAGSASSGSFSQSQSSPGSATASHAAGAPGGTGGAASLSFTGSMPRSSSLTSIAAIPGTMTATGGSGAARDGVRRLDLIRDRLYACTSRGAVVCLAFSHPLLPHLTAATVAESTAVPAADHARYSPGGGLTAAASGSGLAAEAALAVSSLVDADSGELSAAGVTEATRGP